MYIGSTTPQRKEPHNAKMPKVNFGHCKEEPTKLTVNVLYLMMYQRKKHVVVNIYTKSCADGSRYNRL
jgi:hypothetical protein